ncbi:proton-conducting transporter membrane subunit [Streptomyces sp. SLBN-31]|uniref:proton-conducting transporter transmembrane domain-containing protein n=1 Tax=Streptomyces sp. SLBN-31 TaxID=2768444 RepID=UPI0021B314D6|nr:proton-conducting transporter membrane subunit [Streptomyces sp. SLBN-31]
MRAARRKRLMSQEAAVKYFLLGAFASAFTLFGIAMLYGYAGSVSYARIAQVVDRHRPRSRPGARGHHWATTRCC